MLTWQPSFLWLYTCQHQIPIVYMYSPLSTCNQHLKWFPNCVQIQRACLLIHALLDIYVEVINTSSTPLWMILNNWCSFNEQKCMIHKSPKSSSQRTPEAQVTNIFYREGNAVYLLVSRSFQPEAQQMKITILLQFVAIIYTAFCWQEVTIWMLPTKFCAILFCCLPSGNRFMVHSLLRLVAISVGSVIINILFREHHFPELWIWTEVTVVDCRLSGFLKHYLQTNKWQLVLSASIRIQVT